MKDIQQLIKKNSQEGRYEDIFPKTFIDAVLDKESGVTLTDILAMFNMLFLSYNGSRSQTRLQVPSSLRREGLWVTYVLYDKTVVTEWYSAEAIDDTTFGDSANWRDGSNALVGDISISSDGYWVINGEVTNIKAQGEAGITPILRVGSNNHLQVSYTNGSTYVDVSPNPVFTQFRVSNNKLEQSVDLGLTWTVASNYIAAWFRFTGTTGSSQADNVGKIQISRDNGATWSDLSGEFTNSLHIKGYVATVGALPSTAVQGDIYGVGPTYDPSDTEHTNPIYQLYVKDSTGWVNNGRFTSISAGVVQELGNSETEVISQKTVTQEIILKSQGFICSNPITNEIIKELFYNKTDTPVAFSLALNYLASDNKYHNRLYILDASSKEVIKVIFDISYDTLDECKVGLTQDVYLSKDNPVLSGVAINKNYRRVDKTIIDDDIIAGNSSLEYCPIIKSYIEKNLELTNNSVVNLYIKELVAPVSISDIKGIRLNLCFLTGGKYYNACYLDLNPTGVYVVFENAYDTLEECANNCSGVIYNPQKEAGVLVEYSSSETLLVDSSPTWNHALTLNFAPTISNYLTKIEVEKLKSNFDLTTNLIVKSSDGVLKDQFFNGTSYTQAVGYSVSQPILCKAGITYKYNYDEGGMGTNNYCCKVNSNGFNPVAFEVNIAPDNKTATFSFTEDTYVRINCGRILDSIMLTEESLFPNPFVYSQGGNILNESFLLNKAQESQVKDLLGSVENPLTGKVIAWDGDSIAAGAKGTPWASIIMSNNKMLGKNFSVSGATITTGTTSSDGSNRHWVSSNIDTIHQQYPTLDYLILEGGTNDADLKSQFQMGTFDPLDFEGPFDNTTFYGALDYLFSKAVTYYPGTKIGFIVAIKMGLSKYGTFSNRKDFFDKIKLSCEKWGIPYIDLWNTSPMNSNMSIYWNPDLTPEENIAQGYYYADGQHPTTKGYNYTAPMIESWMKTL